MNHFVIYYEYQNPDYVKVMNSKTVTCDELQSLVLELRECIRLKHSNVKIYTIENAKNRLQDENNQ